MPNIEDRPGSPTNAAEKASSKAMPHSSSRLVKGPTSKMELRSVRAAKAVPMFLSSGATYTCDGSAYAGLKALCSIQAHVIEYQGKSTWTDKGLF